MPKVSKNCKNVKKSLPLPGTIADEIFLLIPEELNKFTYTSKVKTLKDFSKKKIKELEKLYKAKIIRRK